MIRFDEAIAIIASTARPLGRETVRLDDAAGRVLAAPVIAAIDSPRAAVSAMDGYAVRQADLDLYPVSLEIIGESFPGVGWRGTIAPGTCVRIFTGAPLPDGADRIVLQEQVRRDADHAVIEADPGPATWVRPRGGDFHAGDPILPAGRVLGAAALIAAGGADVAEVEVSRRPRIALLTTGDELVGPGSAQHSVLAVPDSVSLGLKTLATAWGGSVVSGTRLSDDLEAMKAGARAAIQAADLVVVAGGASVGERDFAKTIFEPLGLNLLFSKISMRPGKPAWFGDIAGKLVLGLPGNPTSALVTGRLLLAPLLCRLLGRPIEAALDWESARLVVPLPTCDVRETFHRARLSAGEATPVSFQESHAQKALAEADVVIRQDAGSAAIPAGAIVRVLRL